jgi:hypothetical protein
VDHFKLERHDLMTVSLMQFDAGFRQNMACTALFQTYGKRTESLCGIGKKAHKVVWDARLLRMTGQARDEYPQKAAY